MIVSSIWPYSFAFSVPFPAAMDSAMDWVTHRCLICTSTRDSWSQVISFLGHQKITDEPERMFYYKNEYRMARQAWRSRMSQIRRDKTTAEPNHNIWACDGEYPEILIKRWRTLWQYSSVWEPIPLASDDDSSAEIVTQ